MKLFFYYFLIFLIYSVLGWIIESTLVSISDKKFINRGFLIGPYCPIYGWGCLFIILYLTQYQDNIFTVFLLGVVICSTLEYFTSYIMEKLFKTRWWDYSDEKFNLNGRICGKNSLLFGLGATIVIYIVNPILTQGLNKISEPLLLAISVFGLIIYITDTIISLNVINRFKKTLTTIDLNKDSTQEFSKLVLDTLRDNHKILEKRLMKAFPNINFKKIITLKNEITEELKELIKK